MDQERNHRYLKELETPIQKGGYSNQLTGNIRWNVYLFRDNYIKAFNGSAITVYKDVILEDQLSVDQTADTFMFLVPIYAANSEGKLTGALIGYIPLQNVVGYASITELIQSDTEEDEEFESRIRTAEQLCYGITSGNKVVVNLRDIPNLTGDPKNGFLIKDTFIEELDAILIQKVSEGSLSQERADLTKAGYQRMLASGQGGIFGINVIINTITTKSNGETLYNVAKVSWAENSNGLESELVELQVQKINGGSSGIPAGTILITKQDGDQGYLLLRLNLFWRLKVQDNIKLLMNMRQIKMEK